MISSQSYSNTQQLTAGDIVSARLQRRRARVARVDGFLNHMLATVSYLFSSPSTPITSPPTTNKNEQLTASDIVSARLRRRRRRVARVDGFLNEKLAAVTKFLSSPSSSTPTTTTNNNQQQLNAGDIVSARLRRRRARNAQVDEFLFEKLAAVSKFLSSPTTTTSNTQYLSAGDILSARLGSRRGRSISYSNYNHRKGKSSSSSESPHPLMLLVVAYTTFFFAMKMAAPVPLPNAITSIEWIGSTSPQFYNKHVQQQESRRIFNESAMEFENPLHLQIECAEPFGVESGVVFW